MTDDFSKYQMILIKRVNNLLIILWPGHRKPYFYGAGAFKRRIFEKNKLVFTKLIHIRNAL